MVKSLPTSERSRAKPDLFGSRLSNFSEHAVFASDTFCSIGEVCPLILDFEEFIATAN